MRLDEKDEFGNYAILSYIAEIPWKPVGQSNT